MLSAEAELCHKMQCKENGPYIEAFGKAFRTFIISSTSLVSLIFLDIISFLLLSKYSEYYCSQFIQLQNRKRKQVNIIKNVRVVRTLEHQSWKMCGKGMKNYSLLLDSCKMSKALPFCLCPFFFSSPSLGPFHISPKNTQVE